MKKNKLLLKIGGFIVNYQYLIICLFFIIIGVSVKNVTNYKVNYDINNYLPNKTETIQGLKLMKKEFGELNEIKILIQDINYEEVLKRIDSINNIDNIKNVYFDKTERFYRNNNALIIINLGKVSSIEKNKIKNNIIKIIKNDNYYLYSNNETFTLKNNSLILIIVFSIILLMILIISHSYFDLILAFIVFSVSILLNVGSNFIFGNIFYVTNDIYIILQLIFSFYFFIIFLNCYYKEIDDISNKKLAIKRTLVKTIPIIFRTSIILITCLIALIFMKLQIGKDIALFISKCIICSMLTIILLLPILLNIFHRIIFKLRHRYIYLNISKLNTFIISIRKIVLPIFLLLFIISLIIISKYSFSYDIYSIDSKVLSNNSVALKKIQDIFGINNQLTVIVKNNDKEYQKELKIAQKLSQDKKIINVINLGNTKIADNLYLGSSINYVNFSDLFNIDIESSKKIYEIYASENNETIKLNDIDNYHISLINIINYIHDKENLPITDQLEEQINKYFLTINNLKLLLESNNYSKFIIEYKGKKESKETFKLLDMIREDIENQYSEVVLIGESISARNIKSTFNHDNIIFLIITLLLLLIIFILIFKSIVMAVILTIITESSVLINLGIGTLLYNKIFFLSYIIVSVLQIGLLINYTVTISKRYLKLKSKLGIISAIQSSLRDSILNIINCGSVLTISGFIIGYQCQSSIVSSVGIFLAIGTIISTIITILILPGILYIFNRFIENKPKKDKFKNI